MKKGALTTPTGRASTTSVMTQLPSDFNPGPDDVICGRGKKCYQHVGNERFRKRVLTHLDEYSNAKSKLDKSSVLSKVVEEVRQNSPDGGFVKQDANGVWHEVGDFLAREKTSQTFRDALHDRYKSSNISKKKRRQEEQAKATGASSKMGRSEYEISTRLERLSNEVLGSHGLHGIEDFNRANYEMLSRLNRMSSPRRMGGSSRGRYSPGSYLPPRSYPDPLFGSSMNVSNAMPSDYGGDRGVPPPGDYDDYRAGVDRHSSFASAPEIALEPLTGDEIRASPMHRSVPDIDMSWRGRDPFDISIHRPAPSLSLSRHEMPLSKEPLPEEDKKPAASRGDGFDPIPLQHINIPGRKASDAAAPVKQEPVTKKEEAAQIPAGSVRSARISRDLMECLDKMTYHSIADDNPFEPIPLTPEQEKELLAKKRKVPGEIFSAPQMDESERGDEFAEG